MATQEEKDAAVSAVEEIVVKAGELRTEVRRMAQGDASIPSCRERAQQLASSLQLYAEALETIDETHQKN